MTLRGFAINDRRGGTTVALLGMAEGLARMHACPEAAVGAIIARTSGTEGGWVEPVAVGWNAAPARAASCLEAKTCDAVPAVWDWVGNDDDPEGRGTVYRETRRAYSRHLHAESMAIANAARAGASVEGAWCYVTRMPCPDCVKLLAAAGVAGCSFPRTWEAGSAPPEFAVAVLAWAQECGLTLTAVEAGGAAPEEETLDPGPCDFPGCSTSGRAHWVWETPEGRYMARCRGHYAASSEAFQTGCYRWDMRKGQDIIRRFRSGAAPPEERREEWSVLWGHYREGVREVDGEGYVYRDPGPRRAEANYFTLDQEGRWIERGLTLGDLVRTDRRAVRCIWSDHPISNPGHPAPPVDAWIAQARVAPGMAWPRCHLCPAPASAVIHLVNGECEYVCPAHHAGARLQTGDRRIAYEAEVWQEWEVAQTPAPTPAAGLLQDVTGKARADAEALEGVNPQGNPPEGWTNHPAGPCDWTVNGDPCPAPAVWVFRRESEPGAPVRFCCHRHLMALDEETRSRAWDVESAGGQKLIIRGEIERLEARPAPTSIPVTFPDGVPAGNLEEALRRSVDSTANRV